MVKTPSAPKSGSRPETTIDLEPSSVQRLEGDPAAVAGGDAPRDAAMSSGDASSASDVRAADEPWPPLPQDAAAASDTDLSTSPTEADRDDLDGLTQTPPRNEAFGDAPPTSGATPPPPPRRRGMGASLLAGLLGGAAALALYAGLQAADILPGFGSNAPAPAADTSAVEAEVAGLRQELAQLQNAPPPADVTAIQAELAGLRDEVAALRNTPPAPAADPALGQAVEALRGEVAALAQRPVPDLGPVEGRLAALEERLAAAGSAQDARADIDGLTERVAAAEALVGRNGESAAEATSQVAALQARLDELGARVDALGQQPKIALAIAASALKAAADRGAPFTAELATLQAIRPDLAEAPALATYAETGVATREQLLAEWDTTADAMIAAARPADPDAGIVDRLLSSAESLVSVRPVGAVAGEGVAEKVARMEVALHGGDLAQALAEYDSLPAPVQAAGAAFAERARARLEVERLVDTAIANAMKAA